MTRYQQLSAMYPENLQEALNLTDSVRKDLLMTHLEEFSIRKGDFILKSGRKSKWFIDSKATACHPQGILLVAVSIMKILPPDIDGIGGLTMGADPVSYATAAIGCAMGRMLGSFSVRKEEKDHGGKGRIAGVLNSGNHLAIAEDTVTRGTSIFEAIEQVRRCDGDVTFVTAIVDRGGTVARMCNDQGIVYKPLVTAPELGFEYEGA
ncbi:orotate phosphoribosyltransferase [Acidithrix ferrooxidans]|uniref:Orotate phosphoribosyltransferase n=1 Tax=Acidithrix ferrooxidans TaxID=1280514 RepID=A0A0D8HJH5_9ACTN|nr:orotate phosphoribosyltransferase [Acidithrix ferrooxidans]KJF17907.1 orotate phosphoribosyltransferase [Acidithrix ferrooxidans]